MNTTTTHNDPLEQALQVINTMKASKDDLSNRYYDLSAYFVVFSELLKRLVNGTDLDLSDMVFLDCNSRTDRDTTINPYYPRLPFQLTSKDGIFSIIMVIDVDVPRLNYRQPRSYNLSSLPRWIDAYIVAGFPKRFADYNPIPEVLKRIAECEGFTVTSSNAFLYPVIEKVRIADENLFNPLYRQLSGAEDLKSKNKVLFMKNERVFHAATIGMKLVADYYRRYASLLIENVDAAHLAVKKRESLTGAAFSKILKDNHQGWPLPGIELK